MEHLPKEQEVLDTCGSQKQPSSVTMDEQQLSEGQGIQTSPSEIQETTPLDKGSNHSDHILVRRMFEVFCITIHPMPSILTTYPTSYKLKSLHDGNPCHICGLVRVFSEDGLVFDIYNRKEVNCEIVPFGGLLSITSSHAISPSYLKVVVYLYDLAHDAEIANGVFELDYRDANNDANDDYDKPMTGYVSGQHGYVDIHYSTIQHAVVADLENVLLNQVGETGSDANNGMLRTVTAHVKRTCKHEYTEEFPPSILFKNTQGSDPFHLGVPIKLFRTSVVVPAFCHLVIGFCDKADRKVVQDIIFEVRDAGLIQKSSQGQCCELKVDVKWRHDYASEATHQVLSDEQSSSDITSAIPKAFPCVEIFSVVIWIDNADADISGTVEIMDSARSPFRIFAGEEKWFPGTLLPIIGPSRSFDNQPFRFQIQMEDAEKRCVSKGSFVWNIEDNDDDDRPLPFYDKLLCSVIQGEVGHAAIHYTLITCGVQARICMTIKIQDRGQPFTTKVYGKITGEYSGYKYPSVYDKEYYKSTLFSKSESDGLQVEVDWKPSDVPLSKSVMCVPLNDMLVLDLDLVFVIPVKDANGNVNEWVKNSVEVKERWEYPTNVNSTDDINFENYYISVYVEWSDERKSWESA